MIQAIELMNENRCTTQLFPQCYADCSLPVMFLIDEQRYGEF